MKRLFDIFTALALGVVAVPICILVAWMIRRKGGGKALFSQVRVGRDLQPFTIYKLRTMRADTGDHASHDAPKNAITPFGARLRRYKVDELPQLWNVLRGEMSFVGPRPCLFTQKELIAARERHGVQGLKPGITGTGQVAGLNMSEPEKLAAKDAEYLKDMSLRADIRLCLATFLGLWARGRGEVAAQHVLRFLLII